jgi:hypothetical protein
LKKNLKKGGKKKSEISLHTTEILKELRNSNENIKIWEWDTYKKTMATMHTEMGISGIVKILLHDKFLFKGDCPKTV